MPRPDQRGECAFGGGFGLAESIPPRVSQGPLAARRQTLQAGHLLGRNPRTSHYKQNYVFSLEPARWDQETAHRRYQLGGGRGRYRGETSADAKAPLSAVCTVCTQDSKKSTGNLLVTLPDARGSGVKPEKQCTYWVNRVINAGRRPLAMLRPGSPSSIGTAV